MARKERKYHYIYKITCLKNNRYYIGMHSTDNLEDGYFGGGKRIKNSVKKHGKDAHRKEILEFFENRESLRQREIQIINEDLLNDPLCMNLQPGGGGGFISEDHRNKWIMNGSSAGNKKQKILWTCDEEWSRIQTEKRRKQRLLFFHGLRLICFSRHMRRPANTAPAAGASSTARNRLFSLSRLAPAGRRLGMPTPTCP